MILIWSDQKPQKGVFRQICGKNEARGARGKFLDVFLASEASILRENAEKVIKNLPLEKSKSRRGITTSRKKNTGCADVQNLKIVRCPVGQGR